MLPPARLLLRTAGRLSAPALLLLAAAPVLGRRADRADLDVVSSHLRAARTALLERGRGADDDPLARAASDGTLPLELRFTALPRSTIAAIAALGAHIQHVSYRYGRVLATAPADLLPRLAALPGVATIHPQYGAIQNSGAITGQGDAALRGGEARDRFGVDGSGTRVGVLSDSFNQRLGGTVSGVGCDRRVSGSSPQSSGDLPADVFVVNDGLQRSTDEGAALGEIVHDVAPGATLLFASAYPSEAAFADSIDTLVGCGVDVLVDDVLYFAEPMFQDGIVAQAAQAAVDSGVAFFSAVGNQGRGGIEATYADAVPARDDEEAEPTGDDLHDFGGGRRFAAVGIPPGCGLRLVLQWDEPFSGGLGPGASTDLDLYLFGADSPDANVIVAALDSQGCSRTDGGPGGDPLEILAYNNRTGQAQTVYVAIDHFCGRDDVHFRIASFPTCVLEDYTFDPAIFSAPQIYGHMAAPGVAATAAVFFGDVGGGGAGVHVEPFSARGGDIPIAFDAQGRPLSPGPVTRFKPELTGPDGINSSFFGADSPLDDDSFRNFFGTSAAAPHAAAVAALLRQAVPSISPGEIVSVLRGTAVDIEAPGRDALSGDGMVDAYAALAALDTVATPTIPPAATPTATPPLAGDCDGSGRVTIDELIVAVGIALGEMPLERCAALDTDHSADVAVAELISAVRAAFAAS